MLQSIIKSAVRNIQKRRINNLLSIIGLTVGFSSFILISMFIKYELSWDAYHENYDRIFRIQTDMTTQGEKIIQTSPALSLYLKNRLTDIEKQCIVMPNAKLFIAASEETESVEEEGQYAGLGEIGRACPGAGILSYRNATFSRHMLQRGDPSPAGPDREGNTPSARK